MKKIKLSNEQIKSISNLVGVPVQEIPTSLNDSDFISGKDFQYNLRGKVVEIDIHNNQKVSTYAISTNGKVKIDEGFLNGSRTSKG